MQRSLRLSLSLAGAAALALAGAPLQPVAAQEDGNAADLGVNSLDLDWPIRKKKQSIVL